MKTLLTSLILLLYTTSPIFGQKQGKDLVDSLLMAIPSIHNDSLKIRLVKRVADEYFFLDTDLALRYSKIGLSMAQKINWHRAIGTFSSSMARAYSDMGNYDSCIYYNQQALAIHRKSNDQFNIAAVLNNMGAAEQNLTSNFPKATQHYLNALRISESMNDPHLIGMCLDNLSRIFMIQGNLHKSLDYAFRGLKSRKKHTGIDSRREVGTSLANIAAIYTELKQTANAKKYYEQALPMLQETENLEGLAKAYTNLSILAGTRYEEKLAYGLKAEQLWNTVNPMHVEAAGNLANIGFAYTEMAKKGSFKIPKNQLYSKAKKYLDKAIMTSSAKNDISSTANFKGYLAELQALTGDYKNAYFNFRSYQAVQDSLYSQENKNQIAELEGKREIGLRDKQIEINRLELQTQKKQRLGLLAGIGLVLIIGILFYRQSRIRKQNNNMLLQLNAELDEANKMKARFFAILSHDLRKPVANLINYLHLQRTEPDALSPDLSEKHQHRIIESAETLLENMESMLLWSKGQMQNFKPQYKMLSVSELFQYIDKFFSGTNLVQFEFKNPNNLYFVTDEDYLKIIMQNLTSNAIQALRETSDAKIIWQAERKNDISQLTISDNGPGATTHQLSTLFMREEIGSKNGFGLSLVRDLAKAIDCGVLAKPGEISGMEFTLIFTENRFESDV